MRYLKLFEELNIKKEEFPENGYRLNPREKQILVDLVGEYFLGKFKIIKEDNYYYTSYDDNDNYNNQFDGFNELKDYILCRYYIINYNDKILDLLQSTTLDPSFDDNCLIWWASRRGHTEVVKLLLQDPRVDPSVHDNCAIYSASGNGHTEVVKLLLQDPRVDPSDQNNEAIQWAYFNRHPEVVKLLLEDPRVRSTLTQKQIEKYEAY